MIDQHNGTTYAYLGDALLETAVREHLIAGGLTKVNDLHKRAIRFTSASGQAKVALIWLEQNRLTEAEFAVFKRGRNGAPNRTPKHAAMVEYQHATGLEAVFGYLRLSGETLRLAELLETYIRTLEESEA